MLFFRNQLVSDIFKLFTIQLIVTYGYEFCSRITAVYWCHKS